MELDAYITDTKDLLRDSGGLFTRRSQLIRYVNAARKQTAYLTGCLRALLPGQSAFGASAQAGNMIAGGAIAGMQPDAAPNGTQLVTTNSFNTIAGVEMYPYLFAKPYIRAQYQGYDTVCDVIDLAVSWGGIRPNMSWLPFDELQAYARSYNFGVTSYPFYWSTNGDGTLGNVWLFPVPSQACEMEWDCTCVPLDIYTNDDYDAIPDPHTSAVKFYAAHLAYLGTQRWGQASAILDLYMDQLGITRAASDRGKTENYYWFNGL